MKTWKPDIFEYLDYRGYLQDYYDLAKQNVPAFSYRYFARRAKLSSPSFLRHVMRGERNLSGTVEQVAHAIGFDEPEAQYFLVLVEFNQAEGVAEQNEAFEKVAAMRRFRSARRMGACYDVPRGACTSGGGGALPVGVREALERSARAGNPCFLPAPLAELRRGTTRAPSRCRGWCSSGSRSRTQP